jgi:hypothetical protein
MLPRLIAAAVLAAAVPAEAAQTMYCSIDDANLALTFEAVVSQGIGEGMASAKGEAKLRKGAFTKGFAKIAIEQGDVTQYWYQGKTLKLRLYRETKEEPYQSLEVIIETASQKKDDTSFSGTYEAIATSLDPNAGQAKSERQKGKITCSAGM